MHTYRTLFSLILALGAAASATSCDSSPESAAVEQSPSEETAPLPSASADPSAPFEGTWRAGPAKIDVIVDHLEAVGLGPWSAAFPPGTRPTDEFVYNLKLQDDGLLLETTIAGKPQGVWDRQSYVASGRTISFSPMGIDCASSFRWTVTGDELTFRPTEDTCPEFGGTPNQVYIQALYGSAPFVRVE